MQISSEDYPLTKTTLKKQLNISSKIIKSSFVTLCLMLVSFGSFSQSSKVSDSKELIKFCHAVIEMNKGYDAALLSYGQSMEDMFLKVSKGDEKVVFPIDQVDFNSYYSDNQRNMASLERTFTSLAVGVKEQEEIVSKIKLLQREKKKLGMFTKAFADYVNTKRHLQDKEKNELSLIQEKINMSTHTISELLMDERIAVNDILFEAENETIDNHDLKLILIPMNEDINDISQILLDSENLEDANGVIEKIKSKRISLANSQDKRQKDAEYYLKNVEHLDLYKNFYLRYQSVLTKSQNVLSDVAVTKEMVKVEWKLNRVSIEQLRNTYQKLKNNDLADM